MKKEILSCFDGGPTPPIGMAEDSWYVGIYDDIGTIIGEFFSSRTEAEYMFNRLDLQTDGGTGT